MKAKPTQANEPLLFIDRNSGERVAERVFGDRGLRLLYGPSLLGPLARALVPRPWVSAAYGRLQRRASSKAKIAGFIHSLGVNADEAELPIAAYPTLDAFFTRRLKPGARPIDPSPHTLVSPADGRALAFNDVVDTLPVKGAAISLSVLLGGDPPFRRAAALVVRLAPVDYHRVHAPCAGRLTSPTRLGRLLHSVHPFATRSGAPSLANKRHISILHTEVFGSVFVVEVGALLVGEIERTRQAPCAVVAGDEISLFHFGGSTVVVVADAARLRFDDDLQAATGDGLETLVRMGTRVGTRIDS